MTDILERIPFNALKIIGGIVSGFAFGPVFGLMLYIFFYSEVNLIIMCVTIMGALLGFVFGYSHPRKVIFRALSAIFVVTLMYIARKFI